MPRAAPVVLECPECEARYTLRRYEADRRVRCRRCRVIMAVPRLKGQPEIAVDPTRREKAVKAMSLPLFATLTIVSLVIVVVLVVWAVDRYRADRMAAPRPRPQATIGTVSLATLSEVNKQLPQPLDIGFAWDYDGPDDAERHEIVERREAAGGALQFEMTIKGRAQSLRQTLHLKSNGLYLIAEARAGAVYTFEPPLLLIKLPLVFPDSWVNDVNYVRNDGGAETWKLRYSAEASEGVTTPAGTFQCYRVEVIGARGVAEWQETLWYAKGVGLVKREASEDPGRTSLQLRSYRR